MLGWHRHRSADVPGHGSTMDSLSSLDGGATSPLTLQGMAQAPLVEPHLWFGYLFIIYLIGTDISHTLTVIPGVCKRVYRGYELSDGFGWTIDLPVSHGLLVDKYLSKARQSLIYSTLPSN
jgi:hypothetical protein